MLTYVHVGEVTGGLGAAVHGKVFRGGDSAVIMRIVALHSGDVGNRQASAQEGILSVRFLASPPARIAKDVNVGRPKIEALENVRVPCANAPSIVCGTWISWLHCSAPM